VIYPLEPIHQAIDTQTYCDWNVDYLKIDLCGGEQYPHLNESWIKFRKAFDECATKRGSPIVMSVEYCGITHPGGDANSGENYENYENYGNYEKSMRRATRNDYFDDFSRADNNRTAIQLSGFGDATAPSDGPATECGSWIPALANLWRTNDDLQPEWDSMYMTAQVLFVHSFLIVHSFIRSFVHSFVHSFIRSSAILNWYSASTLHLSALRRTMSWRQLLDLATGTTLTCCRCSPHTLPSSSPLSSLPH
jgi:hypothetical protein